jgi:ABC-type lipoprotein export system ATPase subunit
MNSLVMSNIFEIKNLECKYRKSEFPVLKIDELIINQGSVVFFIGASGVGKSTILETLGLMNNTILCNSDTKFEFNYINEQNITKEDFISIWKKSENKISKFRREHFSFIFQNTNLFPTLSAYQNVTLTSMLQGNNKENSIEKAKDIFRKILPELSTDNKISELSGGQRQRLAFARAIVSDFSVLFCDEPTGNLDWAHANIVLRALIDNLNENNHEGRTAIIVSHDIKLASQYADEIILIEKKTQVINNEKTYDYGYISGKLNYKKNDGKWINYKNETFSNEEIENKLKESLEKSI